MKILYVGDVMGKAGRDVFTSVMPSLKSDLQPDFVIVQAENSNDNGKGPRQSDLAEMQAAGADFFTGGNHSFSTDETNIIYADETSPIVRPANAIDKPGHGYKIIDVNGVRVLVASMLGQVVGNNGFAVSNPLECVDDILEAEAGNFDVSIVNFHGDYSSEKRVFGYYLDGRVSAVVGDHWHVPTADAMILPHGTAHITDVGMCGSLHSSLGVKTDVIVKRWKQNIPSRNEMEESPPYQFNAVLIEVDESTGTAKSIQQVQRIIDSTD